MRTSDWLLLVLLSVLWGATYFFIAVANPEVPPFTLVLGRVGLAALALVPLVFLLGQRLPATAAGWWPFVVQAVINNVIPFTLMVYGQLRIASGLAAVLNATTPLFTLMVARLFAGEALTANKLAGVALGIAGVGVLVGPDAMSVFEQAWAPLPEAATVGGDALWIGLDAVRDPGNLGTIVRTVDAAGSGGIVLIGHCVDPFSHEAVRASMGSIFNVPLARVSAEDGLPWVRRWRGDIVGAHLAAAEDFRSVAYRQPTLLLMGSEGPGLAPELTAACTRRVRIPMAGRIDSLNLAVATALMVYEIRRERLGV